MCATASANAGDGDRCDRDGLYGFLDQFLAALVRRDHAGLPLADGHRCTENNVELAIGDGLWGTITAHGEYDLRCADPATGEVAYFGTVTETRETSACSLRMKVTARQIAEVELLVVRQSDSGLKFENQRFEHKPVLHEIIPVDQRMSRAAMIALADGYFDTLQLNDGTLHTAFHPHCNRVENGVQTTNNPEFKVVPAARLGCEEQFRLGQYRYDDRLRARRYPLVDAERGLVLAAAFIDHEGRLERYTLTDGREVDSPIRRPHSFYLLELFKLKDGAIEQIESNFITVPYRMPSPWDGHKQ